MKDKILTLCRRLKKSTLDDLVSYLEIKSGEIEQILLQLENDGCIKQKNGEILYLGKNTVFKGKIEKKDINLMFEYRTLAEKEIIIKGFCLEIPPHKLCELINLQKNCVCHYYAIFRKMIYDRQFKELLKKYELSPKLGRYRRFYEKYAYFYVFNGKVFVSYKLLKTDKKEKEFTKNEVREFKITYSFLTRIESHNINEHYLYYRLAEYIWRRNKDFNTLYQDLTNLIDAQTLSVNEPTGYCSVG